jgi:hypothetical protein
MHNCRRVLRMISELHVRGYQRLRMVPHLYALGTWRCGITWAANTRLDHGAMACDGSFEATPQHTSASGREVFAWADATHLTPSRLADLFISRFPAVASRGAGPDWEYAGWFGWMLHETYPDCLPVAFGEYLDVPPGGLLTIGARTARLASPPPGYGPVPEE